MTAADYLLYMERNDFGEDHHFHPQTRHLKKFTFDRVLDIAEMNVFFAMLNLEYNGERFGHHATHYDHAANSLHSSSLLDLTRRIQFPEGIDAWLDAEGIAKLRALYAGDFDFAGSHGHNYELPQE